MARLVTCGFEAGEWFADGLAQAPSNAAAIPWVTSPSPVRSGNRALKLAGATGGLATVALFTTAVALGNGLYVRANFYYDGTAPGSQLTIVDVRDAGGGSLASLVLTTGGQVGLFGLADGNAGAVISSAALSVGWNRLELFLLKASSPTTLNGQAELRLGGSTVVSKTTMNLGTNVANTIATFRIGNVAGTAVTPDYYFDDVAANDSTGATQNSWPGDGKIVLLLPASDVAGSSANFLTGSDVTTNRWDAVNNTPPVGVAPANDTATSQIRDAVKSTTDFYEADTGTYTAAGVGASDTVRVVQGVICYGTGATTAMQAAVQMTNANPTIAETVGTASVAAAVGVHPSNWQRGSTVFSIDPAVTKGSPARIRARKATNNATALHVDYMGVVVEYEPGSTLRTTSDSLGTSDSATQVSTFARSAADTLGTSDSASRAAAVRTRSSADTLGTSDVATRAAAVRARTASDTLGTTDSATQTSTHLRTAGDSLGTTDSARVVLARSAGDSLGTTDAATRAAALLARAASDTLGTSDAATRAAAVRARTAADTLGTSDSATRTSVVRSRSSADTLGTTDAAVRSALLRARSVSDTLGTSDSATRSAATRLRVASDALGTSDLASTGGNPVRVASDTLGTSDSATRSAVVRLRTATDTLGTTDAATRAPVLRARSSSDTLGTADVALRVASYARSAADTMSTSDAASANSLRFLHAEDALIAIDEAISSGNYIRSAEDTLGTQDVALLVIADAGPGDVAVRDYRSAEVGLADTSATTVRDFALGDGTVLTAASPLTMSDRHG